MPSSIRLRLSLAVSVLLMAGCSAPLSDETDSASGAATTESVYDAVVNGKPKIDTDDKVSNEQSASTHVVGYVAGADANALLQKFVSLNLWTELLATKDHKPVFTSVKLDSDEPPGARRTIKAKLTITRGIVSLDMKLSALARADDSGFSATITNSSDVSHFLAGGTVVEKGKLTIDAKFVPYRGGVIFDATMSVKTKKFEDNSKDLTATLGDLFFWVAKPGPK